MSTIQIEKRLAVDGFPELERHWRKFLSLHPDGKPPSFAELMVRTKRHTQILFGTPRLVLLMAAILAMPVAWLYAESIAAAMVQRGLLFAKSLWLLLFIAIWATMNLTLLIVYCTMLVQRYVCSPLECLLADWVGWMLSEDSIRTFLGNTKKIESKNLTLTNPLIALDWEENGWDCWLVKQQHEWITVPKKKPKDMIHDWLIAFLGTKDEVRRKFVSGVYYPSLREGKASVTRFCRQHAKELHRNRNNELAVTDGIDLLEALLAEELVAESEASIRLQRFLTAARKSDFLPEHGLEARIWRRDPFLDLTHQTEFYSSASLRGINAMGRGSKGRLGTFGYLMNPSIFAIDFSNSTGRCVRARVALAMLNSSNQNLRPFLYVDGVEGSNAVAPHAVHQALLRFAIDQQLDAVFYNQYPYNRIPQRMIRTISHEVNRTEVSIRYLDSTVQQYLDAFGWPIEPLEYAFPHGTVIGYWFATNGKILGRKPTWQTMLIQIIRMYSLWLLMGECLLFAIFATATVAPWFIPILGLIAAIGIVSHLRYQQRSTQSSMQ